MAGAHRRRRRDREPAPLPVHFERMDSLRRPCELPSPPCVARRAGAPSAMRQLGELAQKTLALHPTSAGSAISSTDFVGSSSPPIVSYLKCSTAAALALARGSRCARKRGPFGGVRTGLVAPQPRARVCEEGLREAHDLPGRRSAEVYSGVGGRAGDTRERRTNPWRSRRPADA